MMHRYQGPPYPDGAPEPSPSQPQGQSWIAVRLPLSEPRLTYVLLGVIMLVFLYFFSLSGPGQIEFLTRWAKVNEPIRQGQYYRLFTSMFLHLNLMHIAFNGYALYILGRDVEALFGTARFAVLYFLGGLSASLASFVFTSAASVGASGAIFAIFGAEMVYFYQHRELHGAAGQRHLNQLIILMLLNLGIGFLSTTTTFKIDNAGHIGGLISGVVLAWFIGPAYHVKRDPTAENGLRVVDDNPFRRWVLPSLVYAASLLAVTAYAVAA
jgi:rhomboid protease GluP